MYIYLKHVYVFTTSHMVTHLDFLTIGKYHEYSKHVYYFFNKVQKLNVDVTRNIRVENMLSVSCAAN